MNRPMNKNVFRKNQAHGGRNDGPSQPPKNSVTVIADIRVMPRYSPMKNIPNFIPEYSAWYPAINSLSASGISKGRRCVSAIPAIKNTIKPTGCVTIRSEEHTSELQSRRDLVCRLLLEKKKK